MLDEIMQYKKEENKTKNSKVPVKTLMKRIQENESLMKPNNAIAFKDALTGNGISLIAELKKNSPPDGPTRPDFDPIALAKAYQLSGASAISIITDSHFFHGDPQYVLNVFNHKDIQLPILFKDFICSEYQIYEARAYCANAVLLIVRVLDLPTLQKFVDLTKELDLVAIVECFDESDVELALKVKPEIIGINNKNLGIFEIIFDNTEKLIKQIPEGIITVSESGISTREDVVMMEELGFDAMLVGNSILRSHSVSEKIKELLGFYCPSK